MTIPKQYGKPVGHLVCRICDNSFTRVFLREINGKECEAGENLCWRCWNVEKNNIRQTW